MNPTPPAVLSVRGSGSAACIVGIAVPNAKAVDVFEFVPKRGPREARVGGLARAGSHAHIVGCRAERPIKPETLGARALDP